MEETYWGWRGEITDEDTSAIFNAGIRMERDQSLPTIVSMGGIRYNIRMCHDDLMLITHNAEQNTWLQLKYSDKIYFSKRYERVETKYFD